MRVAISNIAWDPVDDSIVAPLLVQQAVDAIDVAPGKYFPDFRTTSELEIRRIREWWLAHGIHITGMQSLLFDTVGLNVFGTTASVAALIEHLRHVCRIGASLGATRLVFGSPRNRDRSGLSDDEAEARAIPFFHSLGDIASDYGVTICLEPNPARYGSNFMLNSEDTAQIVKAVSHAAIRMQLDTGAITINRESVDAVLEKYSELIGHIHASEPDLLTVGEGSTDHVSISSVLKKLMPEYLVSIEMLPTRDGNNIAAIARAICYVNETYRMA